MTLPHLRIEYAQDLDGGDVHVDDLVRVGPGMQQALLHALAEQDGQPLVLLGHAESGLSTKRERVTETNR